MTFYRYFVWQYNKDSGKNYEEALTAHVKDLVDQINNRDDNWDEDMMFMPGYTANLELEHYWTKWKKELNNSKLDQQVVEAMKKFGGFESNDQKVERAIPLSEGDHNWQYMPISKKDCLYKETLKDKINNN